MTRRTNTYAPLPLQETAMHQFIFPPPSTAPSLSTTASSSSTTSPTTASTSPTAPSPLSNILLSPHQWTYMGQEQQGGGGGGPFLTSTAAAPPHQQYQPQELQYPPTTSGTERPRTRSQTRRDQQAQADASGLGSSVPPQQGAEGRKEGGVVTRQRARREASAGAVGLGEQVQQPQPVVGLGSKYTRVSFTKPMTAAPQGFVLPPAPLPPTPGNGHAREASASSVASVSLSPLAYASAPAGVLSTPHHGFPHLSSFTPSTTRTLTPTSTTPSLSLSHSHSSLSPPSLPSLPSSTSSPNPSLSSLSSLGLTSRRLPKRKAKLTNQLRKDILEYAERFPKATQTDIGIRFEVERSTVSKTLKNRSAILKELDEGKANQVKHRPTKYPDVEDAMTPWVARLVEQGQQISDSMIREKALELASTLGHLPKFKASVGWVSGFKNRHHIRKGVIADLALVAEYAQSGGASSSGAASEQPSSATAVGDPESEDEMDEDPKESAEHPISGLGITIPQTTSSALQQQYSVVEQGDVQDGDGAGEEYGEEEDQDMNAPDLPDDKETTPPEQMDTQEDQSSQDTTPGQKQPVPQTQRPVSAGLQYPTLAEPSVYMHDSFAYGPQDMSAPYGPQEHHQLQYPSGNEDDSMLGEDSRPSSGSLGDYIFGSNEDLPRTPSQELNQLVLYTPPSQQEGTAHVMSAEALSSAGMHTFMPATDTIMEEDEDHHHHHGPDGGQQAYAHGNFSQLGPPFLLESTGHGSGHASFEGLEDYPGLTGHPAVQSQHPGRQQQARQAAVARSTQYHVGQPARLQRTSSQTSIPVASSDASRPTRLLRSRSHSEVVHPTASLFTASRDPRMLTAIRIPDVPQHVASLQQQQQQQLASVSQTSTPEYSQHHPIALVGYQHVSPVIHTPADKLQWLDGTMHVVGSDMSEEEYRLLGQIRQRVEQQQMHHGLMHPHEL